MSTTNTLDEIVQRFQDTIGPDETVPQVPDETAMPVTGEVTMETADTPPLIPLPPWYNVVNAMVRSRGRNAPSSGGAVEPERLDYIKRNQQGNIPLDPYTGVPYPALQWLALLRTKEDQERYLRDKNYDVRKADNGDLIVRTENKDTGATEDRVAIPYGLNLAKAASSAVGSFPELFGWALGSMGKGSTPIPPILGKPIPFYQHLARFGKKTPFGSGAERTILSQSVGGSLGAAGVGALTDVGVRGSLNLPYNIPEIAYERGVQIPVNIGLGVGTGMLGKLATMLHTPVTPPRGIAQEALEAQAASLKQGIDYPLSLAESTGSPLAANLEAVISKMPASAEPGRVIRKKQDLAILSGMKKMTGTEAPGSRLPTSSDIGDKSIDIIKAANDTLETASDAAILNAQKAYSKTIRDVVSELAGTGPVDLRLGGEAVLLKANFMKDFWKSTSGYKEFFAQPWTTEKGTAVPGLARTAKKIIDDLSPAVKKWYDTGIFDEFDKPLMRLSDGTLNPKALMPPGTYNTLKTLTELGVPGADGALPRMSLDQLKVIRGEIDDNILRNSVVPGTKNHIWLTIRNSITDAMNQVVKDQEKRTGISGLSAQWKNINKAYADNVEKFTTSEIAPLFREGSAALDPSVALARAIDNPGAYFQYKNFFGPASEEFKMLKRGVLDDIVGDVGSTGSRLVDIQKFASKFEGWSKDKYKKQILADVLGIHGEELNGFLSFVGKLKLDGEVDSRELLHLIKSYGRGSIDPVTGKPKGMVRQAIHNSKVEEHLLDLVTATKNKNAAYLNSIRRDLPADPKAVNRINPEEFVKRITSADTPTKDVIEIMAMIQSSNPAVADQLKIRAIANLFNEAAPISSATETMAHSLSSMKIPEGGKIKGIFSHPVTGEQRLRNLEAIVGPDAITGIQNLAKLLSTREAISKDFATAGALSRGQQIGMLERFGWWALGKALAKNKAFGALYYSIPARVLQDPKALNRMSPETMAQIVKQAVNTPAYVEYMYHVFGESAYRSAVNELNQAADNLVNPKDSSRTNNAAEIDLQIKDLRDIANGASFISQ